MKYVDNLQFDVRGRVEWIGNFNSGRLEINCGEVKSGKGRTEAILQLLKRLVIVAFAAIQILKNYLPLEKIIVFLKGEVITRTKQWKNPTDDEISKLVETSKLLIPTLPNIILPTITVSILV